MPDPLTAEQRSALMAQIRSKNTKPEMLVRRLTHGLGYRYRLHAQNLPGKPDLVFRSRKKAIFVHGCFWHLHGCERYSLPKTRTHFWLDKLETNRQRDRRNIRKLRAMGWSVMIIWECQTKDISRLTKRIIKFLE